MSWPLLLEVGLLQQPCIQEACLVPRDVLQVHLLVASWNASPTRLCLERLHMGCSTPLRGCLACWHQRGCAWIEWFGEWCTAQLASSSRSTRRRRCTPDHPPPPC